MMVRRFFGHIPQDFLNRLRYGRRAPIAHERIWVDPTEIERALVPPSELALTPDQPRYHAIADSYAWSQRSVGRVVDAEPGPAMTVPVTQLRKVRACLRRWREGVSWQEAGAIDHLLAKIAIVGPISGCATPDDVVARYRRLDAIFAEVRRKRRLESQLRRGRLAVRERDGVQVHLGRDGELIFGSSGTHRLAMALALGLRQIPASLGFVHRGALGRLAELRRPCASSGADDLGARLTWQPAAAGVDLQSDHAGPPSAAVPAASHHP